MIANPTNTFETRANLSVFSNRIQSPKMALQNFRNIIQVYPQWEASLFDEHFFTAGVIPMVEAARKNGTMVNSQQVTSAWADQLHLNTASRNELMKELAPIAEQIIAILV
ncbi:MAG: hypothetical protein IIC78_08575 [Chloroflexi bacterium]|nr:hypothetical protein [Chloroflexota bacterium]